MQWKACTHCHCVEAYVFFRRVPVVKLTGGKGLSNQQVAALHRELVHLTGQLIGEVNLSAFEYTPCLKKTVPTYFLLLVCQI